MIEGTASGPRDEGAGAPPRCWCGQADLQPWSAQYLRCGACQTLVARRGVPGDLVHVGDEASDLYGLNYYVEHAHELGHPDLYQRTRRDLSERCVHWLETVVRHRPPPARTLELGCGNGALVGLLAAAGYDATGLDLSPALTGYVRQTWGVPVLTGPLEEQAIAPGSLDLVVMMDVLEHLADPLGTLQAVSRALAPDGLLVLQTPRFDPARSHDDLLREKLPFLDLLLPREHLYLFSQESVRAALSRAGLGHLSFQPAFFGYYDMFLVASRAPLAAVAEADWRAALRRSRSGRLVEALADAFHQARTHELCVPDHAVLARQLLRLGVPPAQPGEQDVARALLAMETWVAGLDALAKDRDSWKGHAMHWKARAEGSEGGGEAASEAPRDLERERDRWKDEAHAERTRARALEAELSAGRWLLRHPALLAGPQPAVQAGAELPLVSIVTPTLNQGRTIRQTLASVAAQTYPRIEHIVVDGGSSDDTVEILKSCPGVRWVSEKDRGQADAINKGLRMASGEIVAYVNSDDLLYPDGASIAVQTFLANPDADFVYGDGMVIDGEGQPIWEWLSRPEDWRLLADYFFLWNDFTNYIMQPASFWRRRLHERIGAFDEGFHLAMDVEFWLRAGASGARLLHVPQRLAQFRMAPGTKSLSSPTVFWEDYLELFRRHHGAPGMLRYVEQYLFEEMLKNGRSLPEAQARYGAVAAKRWGTLPERAALQALGARAGPGALVRLADHAWNAGEAPRARALLRQALRQGRSVLVHPRALVLAAKLLSGPLAPQARRAWSRGVQRYRDRRYQYRYREARRTGAPEPSAGR